MRVAAYARKSKATDKGESIENQMTVCKSFITNMYPGQEHTFVEYKDEGYSGKNTKRPDFSRMMQDVKDGKVDCVVVYRLDRISRNIVDFMNIINRLNKYDVSFVSVNEKFDTGTPMGRAMMTITAVFAELERETIAERVRDNMLMLSQTGRWLGGRTPLGFDSERIQSDKVLGTKAKSRLVRNNEQMIAVHKIYDLYEELGSFHAVGKYLFEHNYEINGKTQQSDTFIKSVLKNPTYCIADQEALEYFQDMGSSVPENAEEAFDGVHGLMPFNRHEVKSDKMVDRDEDEWVIAVGEHMGEISGSRWVRIQRRIEENAKRYDSFSSATNNYALLSGLLVCAKCGKRMYTKPQNKNGRKASANSFFYVCETQKKYTSKACSCKAVRGDRIDDAIVNMLLSCDTSESELRKAVKKFKAKGTGKRLESETVILEAKCKELEQKRSGIFSYIGSLVATGQEVPQDIQKMISDIGKELDDLRLRIATCKEEEATARSTEDAAQEFERLLTDGLANWNSKPIPVRRDQLKKFIDRIEWDGEQLRVFCKDA